MRLITCLWEIDALNGIWPENFKKNLCANTLSPRLKRRLTPLGCSIFEALYSVPSVAVKKDMPWVFASRHGDFKREGSLLQDLAREEIVSPTEFSMSVHNAIMGMFSITTGNIATHTALSGGRKTFTSGLLEALALQREFDGEVGYIYSDLAVPEHYKDIIASNVQDKCVIIMILGKSNNTGLDIRYECMPDDTLTDNEDEKDVLMVIDFFKNIDYGCTCKLQVHGGQIIMEKLCNQK